jgi:K+-transporting ATPase ATPase C chain
MIKNLSTSIGLYLICIFLVGIYCLFLQTVGNLFFHENTRGSLIYDQEKQIRGSYLLGQRIKSDRYFTSRPTRKITAECSNECNVSLYSDTLKNSLLKKFNKSPHKHDISSITPSASLLDPYITERDALIQAEAISKARNIELDNLIELIRKYSLKKAKPFFEISIVNTTTLNAELDGYGINAE